MRTRTIPIGPTALKIFRDEWRKMGPAHRSVDRWRFELGWNIEPAVVCAFLEKDSSLA